MTAQQPPTEYTGNLRPKITYLGRIETQRPSALLEGQTETDVFDQFKVEWIEGTDISKVVWTETVKVPEGYAFVPQIAGYGTFQKQGGFYVDEDNLRHFVMDAPIGIFGAATGQAQATKG
jgi:hypothetical protein